MSHEAARKQAGDLHKGGWIKSNCDPDTSERGGPVPGRPPAMYCLTAAGDHLFPKQYASLTIGLLDTIAVDGDEALTAALTRMTDARVGWLAPHVSALPLEKRWRSFGRSTWPAIHSPTSRGSARTSCSPSATAPISTWPWSGRTSAAR